MEEQPEDFFRSESDLPASTSQELTGLRERLVALDETRAVPQSRSWLVRGGLGLIVGAGVVGVATWVWRDHAPQASTPPAAEAVPPPQPPPNPAPTTSTAPAAKTASAPAAPAAAKKPAERPAVRSAAPTAAALPPPPAVEPPVAPITPVAKEYVVTAEDRRGVEAAVERYRDALTKLDAVAVRAIWPSANANTLAREFGQLQEQQVEFHSCDLDIKETTAAATCAGVVGYMQKVGNAHPRFDDRRWAFTLKRAGSDWLIQEVVIR